MVIKFFNNNTAFVADKSGEHAASTFMAEYYLRKAEKEYARCEYRAYSNGDKEYIFS